MSRSTFDDFSVPPSYFQAYPPVIHPLRYGHNGHLKTINLTSSLATDISVV